VKVCDARLVATMSVYAVESVLTFNLADFKRYSSITPLRSPKGTYLPLSIPIRFPLVVR
jgi:hypothetical protein